MIDGAVNADSSSATQVGEDKEFDWLWHGRGREGSLKGRKSVLRELGWVESHFLEHPCPTVGVQERPAEVQLLRSLWGCG